MNLSNEFFAEFGKLICSLTLTAGELLPVEKELVMEIADDIFYRPGQRRDRSTPAPWKALFAYPPCYQCEEDPQVAFQKLMETWDAAQWSVSRDESAKMTDLIFQVCRAYGLSSTAQEQMLDGFKAELHRRSKS